jgi:hypothetical protein
LKAQPPTTLNHQGLPRGQITIESRGKNSTTVDVMAHLDLLLYVALVALAWAVLSRALAKPRMPTSIPWVGRDFSKVLSQQRATWASVLNAQTWLAEGYEKVRDV